MKHTVRYLIVFLTLCSGLLCADVFSLFPFRGGGIASGVDNALHGSQLWTEEVNINGRALELEVSLVNRSLRDALQDLRGQYKQGAAAANSNSVLFEVPLESGARKRYYLVALNGIIPMLQFSMVLPKNFKNSRSGVWPAEFPLPPGAMPQTVMRLPKRHSVFGSFTSPYPPQQALADFSRNLEGRGWKSIGNESRSSRYASGEVFLREGKNEIIVLSIQNAPSGSGSSGSVYWRKLSGK